MTWSATWKLTSIGTLIAVLRCGLAVAQPAPARAQPFDINPLWLAPGPGRLVTTQTTDVAAHLEVVSSLYLQYQHRPLVLRSSTGDNVDVIDGQAQADAMVALGLFDWGQLSVALPVTLIQSDRDVNGVIDGSVGPTGIRSFFLRDLRIAADVVPFARHGTSPGLRASLTVAIPTGDVDAFAGRGDANLAGTLVSDIKINEFILTAEMSARMSFSTSVVGDGRYGSLLIAKVGTGWQPQPGSALVFEASAAFQLAEQVVGVGLSQHLFEIGIGGVQRLPFSSNPVLRGIFSVGAGGPGAPAFRFLIGLDVALGK